MTSGPSETPDAPWLSDALRRLGEALPVGDGRNAIADRVDGRFVAPPRTGPPAPRSRWLGTAAAILAVLAVGAAIAAWIVRPEDVASSRLVAGDQGQASEAGRIEKPRPYLLAQVLPRNYVFVSGSEVPSGAGYRAVYEQLGRGEAGGFLRITTTATEPELGNLITDAAEPVEVRGHAGRRLPMRDDGEVYGTSILWEESPGEWVMVEAASPLTEADAAEAAAAVGPHPVEDFERVSEQADRSPSAEAHPKPFEAVPALTARHVRARSSPVVAVTGSNYPAGIDVRVFICLRNDGAAPDLQDCDYDWGKVVRSDEDGNLEATLEARAIQAGNEASNPVVDCRIPNDRCVVVGDAARGATSRTFAPIT